VQTDALREALRPKGGEDAVEYAERVEAALEEHHRNTGERINRWCILPGEGPGSKIAWVLLIAADLALSDQLVGDLALACPRRPLVGSL
jgi:hypothetical protein